MRHENPHRKRRAVSCSLLGLIFFPLNHIPLSLFLFFFSVTRAFQRRIGGLECILHEGEWTQQTSDEIIDFSSLGRSAPTIPGSFLWHAYGKTPRFFTKKVTSSHFPKTSQPKSCVLVGRRCAVFMNYAALKTSETKKSGGVSLAVWLVR